MKMQGLRSVFCAAVCILVFSLWAVDLIAASLSASSDRFDGSAELPRVLVKSSLADTPATGHVRLVKESADLQEAIDSAKCGDILRLQAGAVFQGLFRFPDKSCDD